MDRPQISPLISSAQAITRKIALAVLTVRTMAMPPLPILALFSTRKPPVFSVRAMCFDDPVIVIADFRIIPNVIIPVIGIVDAVADAHVSRAAGKHRSSEQ